MQGFGRNFQWKVSRYKWPYLGNGERYGQGYYCLLIESGICPSRWNETHRPSTTLKVTDNQYGQLGFLLLHDLRSYPVFHYIGACMTTDGVSRLYITRASRQNMPSNMVIKYVRFKGKSKGKGQNIALKERTPHRATERQLSYRITHQT